LFSFSKRKVFYQNDLTNSICICNSYGPTFGGGYDLKISDNCDQNNDSYSNLPYSFGKNEGAQ
jgi:hypothetical protein